MSRAKRARGERPVFWIGSSLGDLLDFPEAVKDELGAALSAAQFGSKHPNAKPWKGVGPGVLEIVQDFRGDTYRAIYTVRFSSAVYVTPRFSEEISKRNQDAQKRCGVGGTEA